MSLSSRLRGGETVLSAWSSLPEPLTVEVLAHSAFDAVLLDMQHGGHDEQSVLHGLAMVLSAGKPPVVRIPVGRFDMASRALDFGAEAVIAPMINSAEDARKFAASMKYPPIGERSWGVFRASADYGAPGSNDYLTSANRDTLAFAMIETREAFDALDAILDVRGIDGVFVGPSDFSIAWSNGLEANPSSEAIIEPVTAIARKAAAAGKFAGIYAPTAEFARRYIPLGFQFLTLSTDGGYIRLGAQTIVDDIRA
ncbi:2,4-dihydroxyhept-2-ene-1,7-dioic acid aldolase [Falsochrobactrum shanghaiense]|uniref:2,4-dihydroxyhept-2-ene-1,7-dioic acid aldolase n=1 Tax=Falsochrobactrum shanghaiense TaxID=2201899 RepID=A0A316JS17_9HYPH|nr:HpcH/HpaI aldolase/citrate lyase family protein [Falsochrobactrum shanghaiense]PWL18040.1 2,4-dihydroxyhept-2-ene-1,7-dioic acid aldolase [Falsochrobactrum shanghaiense]